jgi:hypothetical protein
MIMRKVIGLVAAIFIALAMPVLAQPPGPGMGGGGGGPGMGGRGAGPGMGPQMYNPQTVTTVQGTVESLGNYPSLGPGSRRGMRYRGVVLKTDQGPITVHLGPSWYLSEEKFPLKAGETMEVTGSKIAQDGTTIIMASEVKANGKTLKLRDEQGFPVWRGAGRGR